MVKDLVTGPALVARDSRLYVAWYSAGRNGPGIRLATSSDRAKTFSIAQIVSPGVLDANHPVLSISEDGRIALTFQGRDPAQKNGWSATQPFISEIASDGSASTPQAVFAGGYSALTLRFSQPATVGFSSPGRKYKEAEMMCNSFAEEKEESEITLQALPWLFPWFI